MKEPSFYSRRRQWHPTAVLLPGKSHGRRSLVGCSPWGRWGSDMTEQNHFHFSLSCIGEGNGNPLQCSCLENPRDGGALWAAIYGVAQSQTGLKRLSSSSSSSSLSRKIVDYFIVWPWVSFTSNHSLTWEIKIQIELAAGRSNLPLRSKETNPFLLEIQVMPLLGQMSYRGSPFLWPIVIISCCH